MENILDTQYTFSIILVHKHLDLHARASFLLPVARSMAEILRGPPTPPPPPPPSPASKIASVFLGLNLTH